MFRRGTTRGVFIVGPIAIKLALNRRGVTCNKYEADVFKRVHDERRSFLCPVVACSPLGIVLIMRAAASLTDAQYDFYWGDFPANFPDWYDPHEPSPLEPKREDWGMLDGRLVAVDYANSTLKGVRHERAAVRVA